MKAAAALFCLATGLASGPAIAGPVDPAVLQAALDNARAGTLVSGGAAALVQDGRTLWHGQSGATAPQGGVPLTERHLFALGSIGKTYSATLAMALVERGSIDLDSPVGAYLPAGLPGAGEVTVRMLLNHTSGYPEIYDDPWVSERLTDLDYAWTRQDLLQRVQAPSASPGSGYAYSNTNYVILGEILERASGRPVEDLLQESIVTPLGLTRTFMTPRAREELAHGTFPDGGSVLDPFDWTAGVPTGLFGPVFQDHGVAATALDTALFLTALLEGEILSEDALAEMLTFPTDDRYGMGLFAMDYAGHTWFGHNGGWGGYTSLALYRPDARVTVVATANLQDPDAFPVFDLWRAVADAAGYGEPVPLPGTLWLVGLGAACALRGARGGSLRGRLPSSCGHVGTV